MPEFAPLPLIRNMTVQSAKSLRNMAAFRWYRGDERGSVAMVFALSLLVLAIASGIAMDYARSVSTTSSLQQDLDSTLLFVARAKLQSGEEHFNAQAAAENYIRSLRRQKHINVPVRVALNEIRQGAYKAIAKADVPTTFSRIVGVSKLAVEVAAEVELGEQPVEVSLVLDNTGSMQGAKMDALKAAAKSLVETAYKPERAAQNVRIGLVPFAQYVNVGLTNRSAPWLSVAADTSVSEPEQCYDTNPVTGSSNCRIEQRSYVSDGLTLTYDQEVCDYTYGPPQHICYTPVTTNTWHGCVGSRPYPLETLDEQYDTKIPGIMNAFCSSEVSPLTNDTGLLNGRIDAMVAAGETYIPGGLIWGWRLLSKQAPYTEAKGYDERVYGLKTRKLLVLMTDGMNTLSPTYPWHSGTDTNLANSLTSELCTNIKAKGITIYSVAFDVDDDNVKDLLKSCASGDKKYFDAGNGGELDAAFREIAQDFSPIRIAR